MKASLSFEDRLVQLVRLLEEFLDETKPDHAFVEDVWFNKNAPNLRSMSQVAKAVGAVVVLLRVRGITVDMMNVQTVRRILKVKGARKSAELKKVTRRRVNQLFDDDLALIGHFGGLAADHQDMADAIAVAAAGIKWKSTEH